MFGVRGFRVSPGHFAERFSLIVIVALGESIVAIGTGLHGVLDAGTIAAALLGLVLAFGHLVGVLRRRRGRRGAPLGEAQGMRRIHIARDSYSYLHLPMIAGIVLMALAMKKTLAHVDEPLDTVPAVALFGGIALYYAGHLGFRLRNVGTLNRQRLVALLVCLALIPVGTEVDAIVALALATLVTSTVIAYEAIHFADARSRIRQES